MSTPRAVEVVTCFDDEVIAVHHLVDPRSERTRVVTAALLASGAMLLAAALIGFGLAAHTAAANRAALNRFEAAGGPRWAFRPTAPPSGTGLVVIGGALLGLAALSWGLARGHRERRPARVRIDGLDVVAPAGDGFAAQLAPGADRVRVTAKTRLLAQIGAVRVSITSVPAATPLPGARSNDDGLGYIAAAALLLLGALALLRTAPDEPDPTTVELADRGLAMDHTRATLPAAAPSSLATTSGGDGTAPGPPLALRRRSPERPAGTRADAPGAPTAGILGSRMLGDATAAVTGDRAIALDGADGGIWGAVLCDDGACDGDGGGFGFGRAPSGGPRIHDEPIQVAMYLTNPLPEEAGTGYGIGNGRCGERTCRGRHAGIPDVRLGTPTEIVGCDPALIRRAIKRNLAKITYCYEKRLLMDNDLAGTVETLFTIMPDGTVADSSASGVDREVASCFAEVMATVRFPRSDAMCQVRYPFHVHPAGN